MGATGVQRPSGAWLEAMGLVIDEASGVRMVAHMELTSEHRTPWGVIHGGVYATIVESVASVGASLAVAERDEFAVGVHNGTDFLRSMSAGRIDVVGVPIQQGRTQQLWEVTITRPEDGRMVAQGRLRLQNVPVSRAG